MMAIKPLLPYFENPLMILHCPQCRKELVSQEACESARKMIEDSQGDELTDVFCDFCKTFHKIPDLLAKERYYN